jgi:curved DNA-binding protein CbpA
VSWSQARLAAWLDHVEPAIDRLSPFELLEIPPTASGDHVQRAFHEIASTRHPDLWRNQVPARQLERVVRVYGRVTAAYATLRDHDQRARVLRDLREHRVTPSSVLAAGERDRAPAPIGARGSGPQVAGAARARSGPTAPPERLARATMPTDAPAQAAHPAGAAPAGPTLGARALGFYRRAQAALRLGDVAGAVLNLRMAVSAEPTSAYLRQALADAQARLHR